MPDFYLQLVSHHYSFCFVVPGVMQSAYLITLKRYLGIAPIRNIKRPTCVFDLLAYMSFGERIKVGFSFAVKVTLVTLNFDQ